MAISARPNRPAPQQPVLEEEAVWKPEGKWVGQRISRPKGDDVWWTGTINGWKPDPEAPEGCWRVQYDNGVVESMSEYTIVKHTLFEESTPFLL